MQVEVCVQECFDPTSELDDRDPTDGSQHEAFPSTRSISAETWALWFQTWLEVLQPDLSPIQAYELSLRLTNDREIQLLNHQYRQQDKPTDVLAFAALEADYPQSDVVGSSDPLYLGDIVISVDTAQRQATTQAHSLDIELSWLAAHGLLHLLGWDHPDDESLNRMLEQQQHLLSRVGLAVSVLSGS